MKTWQFEVDGQLHILKLDTQKTPIHRFAFTMMWMMFCWSAFVILASRGIIKIANIPLF